MNILICGIGALGSNLTARLVVDLHGQHQITVLDKDKVEERNIQAGTQFFTPDQIGLPKVEALQFNIYRHYQREIETQNKELLAPQQEQSFIISHQLRTQFLPYNVIIDCFDNYKSRLLLQQLADLTNKSQQPIIVLHIGFSQDFTFAIEWAEHYKVPSDINGLDICTMPGASSFINVVASMGALVAQDFINGGKKINIVGNKYSHTLIK